MKHCLVDNNPNVKIQYKDQFFCSDKCAFETIDSKLGYDRFNAFRKRLMEDKKQAVLFNHNGNHILFDIEPYYRMTWLKYKPAKIDFSYIPSYNEQHNAFDIEDLCFIYFELVKNFRYTTEIIRSEPTSRDKEMFCDLLDRQKKFAIMIRKEGILPISYMDQGSQSGIVIWDKNEWFLHDFQETYPFYVIYEEYNKQWIIARSLCGELYKELIKKEFILVYFSSLR